MTSLGVSKRINYFDVFRGLGIICMVMGHIGFGGVFDHLIHAFHMPMFFFVSGFFYKDNDSIGKRIQKKAKALLIPYLFFGIAHYVVYLLMQIVTNSDLKIEPLLRLFTINTDGLAIAGALWFLTALFITDIFYSILDRHRAKWIIIPLILIGSFTDQYLPYPLPWALSAAFVGLGLYYLGEYVKNNELKFRHLLNMNWAMIIVVGLVTAVLVFLNGYINMREGKYAIIPLFWINALLSIFVGISISKKVCKLENVEWIKSIGKNSIVYVCLNQITILFLTKLISLINLPMVISKIVILAISMIILQLCCILFTKTKLKCFIGK